MMVALKFFVSFIFYLAMTPFVIIPVNYHF
ncbi:hypothetical protein VCRA2116O30_20092 [Vibrio crassostreae]|nr:hypothetical protein VCRA2118O41_100091 [Vibrio crassostreae]CAK1886297.1 hypothetical protein VCRA2111O320_10499 [Vibrio crassostreae]CAK1999219.1 hypothetical protein VCRA2116O30_20092 [Vibrio crassostreae]CAK2069869.1 hypothetical protein VCRA2119O45_30093 [Vibrio crassostreae]CAK2071855.1 hypothetical protein VCRA2113O324_30168 [Vibrio crassostreae]